ncbi:hypothetical protein [Anaerofustis butyriciformans]
MSASKAIPPSVAVISLPPVIVVEPLLFEIMYCVKLSVPDNLTLSIVKSQ